MQQNKLLMKKGSTLFLKAVIVFIIIVVLAIMIRFPQTEGRAADLDLISIYTDPFIIYMYIASIPFFVALYQIIKLLGFVEKNQIFSQTAVKAVRRIKYCAIVILCFLVVGIGWVRYSVNSEDTAGFTAFGITLTFTSIVIATVFAVFQKLLQNAVNIQSENDLTV